MRTIVVNEKYNNRKLSVFLQANFDGLSSSTFFKALRRKDILVNNIRVKENVTVHTGDSITTYITDEYLFKQIDLRIIYEDENILVVDKPVGIEVVSVNKEERTLTSILQRQTNTNVMPCHRLDRNTSGLVLFAKNETSLEILLEKFKNHEIQKYYRCTVFGIPDKNSNILEAYLFKDNKKSRVYIYDEPKTSLLEVLLHTGKTHQIRAHLAHIGHPIIGDREIW